MTNLDILTGGSSNQHPVGQYQGSGIRQSTWRYQESCPSKRGRKKAALAIVSVSAFYISNVDHWEADYLSQKHLDHGSGLYTQNCFRTHTTMEDTRCGSRFNKLDRLVSGFRSTGCSGYYVSLVQPVFQPLFSFSPEGHDGGNSGDNYSFTLSQTDVVL